MSADEEALENAIHETRERRDRSERRQQGRRKQSRPPGEEKDVLEGNFVFREHETAQEAFIVKSGTVEIFKSFNEEGESPREVTLGKLGPGSMFGEMALINDEPRMASARAVDGNLKVYVISRRQFDSKIGETNLFISKLLQILAENARTAADKVK